MVRVLSSEGMSTRAIAPIVATSHPTVVRDLAQVIHHEPVEESLGFDDSPEVEFPTLGPKSIIGLNGKTYLPIHYVHWYLQAIVCQLSTRQVGRGKHVGNQAQMCLHI
ncbi:MAG: hypothetical protein M1288_03020 [Actinobacteria bacterium]|nr:hypothetical protein [Actinomycetota bacterium]